MKHEQMGVSAPKVETLADMKTHRETLFAKRDELLGPGEDILRKKRGTNDPTIHEAVKKEYEDWYNSIWPELEKIKDALGESYTKIMLAERKELAQNHLNLISRRDELYKELEKGESDTVRVEADIEEIEKQLNESLKKLQSEGLTEEKVKE